MKTHQYRLTANWTGNTGTGTTNYRSYERSHTIIIEGKSPLSLSSDQAFRGNAAKWNPEELLLASLSSCHMLSYLHVCVTIGVIVTKYEDVAEGVMQETADGGGRFECVTLHPNVTVKDSSMIQKATEAHHRANELCFIASSVNFPVHHIPKCVVEELGN